MKVSRRAARVDDVDLLFRINRDALGDHVVRAFGPWDETLQRRLFEERTDLVTHELILSDEQAVGFWAVTRSEGAMVLQRLCILPEFQNRGIGSSLIAELVASARTGQASLELAVFPSNRARRLFERLGFRVATASTTHFRMVYWQPLLQFQLLADRPNDVPTVTRWWVEEWGLPAGCDSLDAVAQRVLSRVGRGRLPLHLVAVLDDTVVGTAILKQHELENLYPDLDNWLGNVFVHAQHRGQHIATGLTVKALDLAAELDLRSLHLQTVAADGGLYTRLGWTPLEKVHLDGVDKLVVKRAL